MARMSESIEQNDMCAQAMKEVIERFMHQEDGSYEGLVKEERNLLSSAWKECIGKKRTALRAMAEDEQDHEGSVDGQYAEGTVHKKIAGHYAPHIQSGLKVDCETAIALVHKLLGPLDDNENKGIPEHEAIAFYRKMAGDYYRYMAECEPNEDAPKDKANDEYHKANEAAQQLDPCHPTKLGLALNMSVFLYEIKGEPQAAKDLAQRAHREAEAGLESCSDSQKVDDAKVVLTLLSDNLELWEQAPEDETAADASNPVAGSGVNAAKQLKEGAEQKAEAPAQEEAAPAPEQTTAAPDASQEA